MRWTWALALAAGFVCGCRTEPPTRTIFSSDPDVAREVAGRVDRLELAIRKLLPGTWTIDLDVVVEDEWDDDYPTSTGYTLVEPGRGHASIHLNGWTEERAETLAHELVHALIGTAWRTLPPVVEEGLCTWVAEQYVPPSADDRAARLANLSSYFGEYVIPLDFSDPDSDDRLPLAVRIPFERRPDALRPHELLEVCGRNEYLDVCREAGLDRSVRFQEVGYLIARRIVERRGTHGLLALCIRARDQGLDCVPSSWLAEAANFEILDDWLAGAWGAMDPSAFEVWTFQLPELSIEPLAWTCRERLARLVEPGDDVLEICAPSILFGNGEDLPLAEIVELRSLLEAPAW